MTRIESLTFGNLPPEEAVHRRRSEAARRKQPENQEDYAAYRLLPAIEEILKRDWDYWQESRKRREAERQTVAKAIWGQETEIPWYIHPSTASFCLRWVGYEALGTHKPAKPTTEANLRMMMGSATHESLLKKLVSFIPEAKRETSITDDDAGYTGRVDLLLENRRLNETQVVDVKCLGSFPFNQLTRKGLPSYLRPTKGICQPSPEHRKQVLLYMWALREKGEEVGSANLIYINRDSGKMKEGLVLWDLLSQFDAEQLVTELKEARTMIDQGKLPPPSVESKYICGSFCPYRIHCEPGREFAATQVKKEKKRRPQGVYRKAKEEREKKRELIEQMGLVQALLPGLDDIPDQ